MTKKTVSQYVIGVVMILFVFIGCASNNASRITFTPGTLKNDIGGIQNLPKTQFFLSEGLSVKYTRITRTPVVAKNGVITVKTDTFTRTFNIKKDTPGVFRTKDNAKNPVDGWRIGVSPYSGRDIAVIQLMFWNSNDNYLEFEAFYDENFDDRFAFFSATFSD
jgi:hypothetical protein